MTAPALRPALVALAALAAAVLVGCAAGEAGAQPLDGMPIVSVRVDGAAYRVRLAATDETRAQGFQHVPPSRMHEEAIYFTLPESQVPAFHMRNVAAPLLIAWIAADCRVLGIDVMAPGTVGHSPAQAVPAALEFTARHPLAEQVRPGTCIELAPD